MREKSNSIKVNLKETFFLSFFMCCFTLLLINFISFVIIFGNIIRLVGDLRLGLEAAAQGSLLYTLCHAVLGISDILSGEYYLFPFATILVFIIFYIFFVNTRLFKMFSHLVYKFFKLLLAVNFVLLIIALFG